MGKTVVAAARGRPLNQISALVLPGTKKCHPENLLNDRATPSAIEFTDDLASYNRIPTGFGSTTPRTST